MAPRSIVVALNRLRALFARTTRERDMDEEMRFHLEAEAADLQRRGMSADDARRQAALSFGGIDSAKEDARDVTGFRLLDDLAQDLRYAARQLRSSPGFTAATMLTLALGIGATTSMYTIVRTVTTLPYELHDADHIVHIGQGSASEGCAACNLIAIGNYITIRDEARSFQSVDVFSPWNPSMRGVDRTDVVNGVFVTPSFFETLGTRAMLGRTLLSADTLEDAGDATVISETLWRARFNGDRNVIGSRVFLDGRPRTIVGVIATRSSVPQANDVWALRKTTTADIGRRVGTDFTAIGRLRDGVSLQQARAELSTIATRTFASESRSLRGKTFGAMRIADWSAAGGDELTMLMLAVALVLVVACINVAGLLTARLTNRQRELALRTAIGASALRLGRQLLTETIVLTLASSVLGTAFAFVGVRVVRETLVSTTTRSISTWPTMEVDLHALGAALAVGAVAGLMVGLWPAIRFARSPLIGELQGAARSASASRNATRGRSALVVLQMAFAVMLLSAASLLMRSERNVRAIRPGFRADGLITLSVTTPIRAPGDTLPLDSARFERLAERIATVPGIVHAATVLGLPYASGLLMNSGFDIEGAPSERAHAGAQISPVSSNYFATMELPIVRGRTFSALDVSSRNQVAIVDQLFADRYFPNENPIGRVLVSDRRRIEIVGVVPRVGHQDENAQERPQAVVYLPTTQRPSRVIQVVARMRTDSPTTTADVIAAVHEFNRDYGVSKVKTMEQLIAESNSAGRVLSGMMLAFALATILISALGLYGLVSYNVARRSRELGIRLALGATGGHVLRLVLGEGGRLAFSALVLGAAAGVLITRGMRAMLYGITPTDPSTFAGVCACMACVALAAAYLPAARVARIDPVATLRED